MLPFGKREPQMKKVIIVMSCIMFCTHINGMKRPSHYIVEDKDIYGRIIHPNKRHKKEIVPFYYEALPTELQKLIFDFATIETRAEKPKVAAKTINALTKVNREFSGKINEKPFSDQLIKNLAHKFFCSHETIARYLQTHASRKRLCLQNDLRRLCYFNNDAIVTQQVNGLIAEGVDLEFTYNHHGFQQTVLAISLSFRNCMFELLLAKGANINSRNAHGWSPLHFIAVAPAKYPHLPKLIDHPSLDINKQNGRGETALLRTIIQAHEKGIDFKFIDFILHLLNHNADPEIPNKLGLTPLTMAEYTGCELIINLINNAIEDKNNMGVA